MQGSVALHRRHVGTQKWTGAPNYRCQRESDLQNTLLQAKTGGEAMERCTSYTLKPQDQNAILHCTGRRTRLLKHAASRRPRALGLSHHTDISWIPSDRIVGRISSLQCSLIDHGLIVTMDSSVVWLRVTLSIRHLTNQVRPSLDSSWLSMKVSCYLPEGS